MKIKPPIFAALALSASANAQAQAQAPKPNYKPGYKLVWADEFNAYGPPDARKWNFETGFARNEEAQWYGPGNAWCRNGLLSIEARRELKANPGYEAGSGDWKKKSPFAQYTSSSLTTNGLHSWRYGRFEMRARIDTRAGLWPAFWTVGTTGEWPSGGEIDIMEFYRGNVLANVAWATERRWNAKWDSTSTPLSDLGGPDWSSKFHLWRMDWDKEAIRLYVDNRMLNETLLKGTVNGDAGKRNPFHDPQFIILNLAVGGQNGGDPAPTAFPARFEIDYVRVFQTPAQIAAQDAAQDAAPAK